MRALFIGVNYNATVDCVNFLASVGACGERAQAVVADNSPVLDPKLVEACGDRGAQLRHYPTNPGYFGAAHAVVESLPEAELPDWVIVSNVDVVFEGTFIGDLLDVVTPELSDETLVLAPRIESVQDGRDQNPFLENKPPRWSVRLRLALCNSYPLYRTWVAVNRLRYRARARPHVSASGQGRAIYAPHGSFIAFTRDFFRRGGRLSHAFPLYGEEILVAEQVRELGGHVRYEPRLEIRHTEHAATSSLGLRKRAHLQSNFTRYMLERYYE